MTFHGIPIPYTDRDDWLTKRKEGIGASDVAGILGLSPWSSPFVVWADKTKDIEREANESMEWGKALEDVILARFTSQEGIYIGARELLVRHPGIPWVMATVDGLGFDGPVSVVIGGTLGTNPEAALGNVQVKTDGGWKRWSELPHHIEVQVQWEMLATGLEHTWVPVLHSGRNFQVYETDADPHLQKVIFDKVKAFRDTYLLDPEAAPPDPIGSDAETRVLVDLWDADPDEVIELSPGMAADVALLEGLKAEAKRLETEIKKYEGRVKVSLQDATVGTVNGVPRVTWMPTKEVEVQAFTRQAGRRFTIKPIKSEED
jgi:putative phage-type endonuclease